MAVPHISDLETPAFLVDIRRVKQNVHRMTVRCHLLGVKLRPHMKTHKTIEGAFLMTGARKHRITVSTLKEAEFFADRGFDDILYAQPLVPSKVNRCKIIAERLDKFHVMLDHPVQLDALLSCPLDGNIWSAFIEIDCGYGGAGIIWDSENLLSLAKAIDSHKLIIKLAGIYTNCSTSYDATNEADILNVGKEFTERMCRVADILRSSGLECPVVSIGSTQTCSIFNHAFKAVTELHPGNYIFYDLEQVRLGSCIIRDIACKVATRVMGHYPEKNQMLIDLGFTGLTLHGLGKLKTGYGEFENEPNLKLDHMTQEVGFVKSVNKQPLDFDKYPIGTMLFIYPYHSCATAGMYPIYYVHVENRVIEEWIPTRGW